MIISHKHKFLFIEIPLTASWSIHHELCDYYDGKPILHKHATYAEFRASASVKEKEYSVFAAVRNPLDKIVSRYWKLKSDQKGVFTNKNSLENLVVDYSDLNRYEFIKNTNASFEDYLIRFYKLPYSDMIDLSAKHLDYTIRFENLQQDFSTFLKKFDIQQVRPLPQINITPEKSQAYLDYYTPQAIEHAKQICAPFMKKWNYQFPESWGKVQVSTFYEFEYSFFNLLRYYYANYLRYNNASYAVFLRKMRAKFFS